MVKMIELGRLCLKIAGRDAGKKCVVIDVLDNNYVLIDGETRRRKCNISHLEPLDAVIEVKKKASHDEVKTEFKKLGLNVLETKPKPKTERPKKVKGKKVEIKEDKKKVKKEKKKAEIENKDIKTKKKIKE